MIRELKRTTTYQFNIDGRILLVTIERGKNTSCGTPRFKAAISEPKYKGTYTFKGYDKDGYNGAMVNLDQMLTHNYTFNGHYMDDWNEAYWIANQYVQKVKTI